MGSSDSLILLPYQRDWVNDTAPIKLWVAARQIGKSFAISKEAVAEALWSRCDNLILSSSERQSMEVMQKVRMHMRALGGAIERELAQRETREEISLPNGSRIISLPANADTVRGFSGNVYLDEFAFHDDSRAIWRAMYPTVTRGYKVRVTSTPNGRLNMFYELYQNADGRISRHVTTIHDAVRRGLDVDLARLRAGIGDPMSWAQEYECEFLDEATAHIPLEMIDECCYDGDGSVPRSEGGECHLGVDIGRSNDMTVMWLLVREGETLWTREVLVMRGAPFSEQRAALYALIEAHGVRRACIDATGIGAQMAEEAKERFGSRVEPVQFTLQVKEDLAVTARRAFEDRSVRIPRDEDIRRDIHSIRRFTTPSGNARFDAERTTDGHGDRFWALALALHAAQTAAGAQLMSYESVAQRGAHLIGRGGSYF